MNHTQTYPLTSPARCDLDAPFLFAYRKTSDDWLFEYMIQPQLETDIIRAIVRYNSQLEDAFKPYCPVGIICLFPAIGAYSCCRQLDALEAQP